jgi:glycosyltransferase involved in cell wall biosynthesis
MTPRLKIIVAHNSYRERGGEDAVVDAEVALLRSCGHEVIEYRRDNTVIASGYRFSLLRQTLWSQSVADEVSHMIHDAGPDVVHVHNTFPLLSPAIYWAAASARVPVVQTLHNFRLLCAQATFLRDSEICEDCLGRLPWRGVVRKCYRDSAAQSAALVAMLGLHRTIGTYRHKVNRYIALSQFSKRKFVEGGLPAQKISVKPNFVDTQPASRMPRGGGLYVGRLSAEKGLHVLVAALRALPHLSLDVIGTGPQLPLLTGNSQIRMLGQQDSESVLQKMAQSDFLVMPSICYEQFPRTLVEAFACGLPVIASRLGPLAELVEDGQTGLLFEVGSTRDLAEKIEFATSNPEVMREMGRNARAEYEAKYTPQRNYQQLMEIYSDITAH